MNHAKGFQGSQKRSTRRTRIRGVPACVAGDIAVKNLLAMGAVSADEVIDVIHACQGRDYSSSPHHAVPGIEVHVLRRCHWYIKFFFIEPHTWFISVHQ